MQFVSHVNVVDNRSAYITHSICLMYSTSPASLPAQKARWQNEKLNRKGNSGK